MSEIVGGFIGVALIGGFIGVALIVSFFAGAFWRQSVCHRLERERWTAFLDRQAR
jgi:hypothetical protein